VLGAGTGAPVQVVVTVPPGTLGGTLDEVTVRARSQSDGTVIGVAIDGTTVSNVANVQLAPDHVGMVAPATVARYVHTLSNNGNFTDTIDLAGSSSQGWTVVVMPAMAIVPAGGSAMVAVSVTVPAGTPAGVMDITTITATSSAAQGVIADAVTDVGAVMQVAGVSLAPNYSSIATPGTDIVYSHTVTNLGNGTDTLDIAAVSSRGWTVTANPANVTLNAGASASIQVTLTIPISAGGQTDVTTVKATSSYNDTVSANTMDTTLAGVKVYLPVTLR